MPVMVISVFQADDVHAELARGYRAEDFAAERSALVLAIPLSDTRNPDVFEPKVVSL